MGVFIETLCIFELHGGLDTTV